MNDGFGTRMHNAMAASWRALPVISEVRVARPMRPLTDRWQRMPVAARGPTRLGISFRPRQVEMLGLEARETFNTLLAYPFDLVRLGAYWNRIEPEPDQMRFEELDWQVDAAERAGKQIILNVGAVKTFGYPEYFVPVHRLDRPLREGALVRPEVHRLLLDAATAFIARVVERYRTRPAVVVWQVEHEAVDPLGMEHSWRLAADFVHEEVAAVRAADPSRPVLLTGFLPTSTPVRLQQWWRTRDQGDSLEVAQHLADIVGIDYYPRHALVRLGTRTIYLDGCHRSWQQRRWRRIFAWATAHGQPVMVSEGQAEPWETVTSPPNPKGWGMYSCLPEQVIANYNHCMGWTQGDPRLDAYLFWGAEYWLLRRACGDTRYLQAFARIIERA